MKRILNAKGYAAIQTDIFDKIHSFSPGGDCSQVVKVIKILLSKGQYFETMQKCVRFEVYTVLSMKLT
jgi:hypothetical protein